MIYRIENSDGLIIPPNVNSPAYLRISGFYKAYGVGYNFIGFYTNTSNTILICVKQRFADIYISSSACEEDLLELETFVLLNASEFITEQEFHISHRRLDIGKTYTSSPILDRVTCIDEIAISHDIRDCFELSKDVFLSNTCEELLQVWYTDLSHRVRHGMSRTYTLKQGKQCISTAIAYAFDSGVVLIAYLGTHTNYRNRGYARFLLNHISRELKATKIVLQSQDEESDNFYEKLGFTQEGSHYSYIVN